ncbi:MAG: hypothetical protein M3416_10960 [Acidobacteriota bacterium]|nr:hypothetical protein [Acidobacteriota bacterium]
MKSILVLCLCAGLLAQAPGVAQQKSPAAPPPPPDHGGKIETKYDGLRRETVVALRPMTVTCGGAKGAQGITKGVCVNLAASLHCPGQQLDYVRYATLQITFETKDWDKRHPPDQRALSAVADGETIPLGTLRLVKQEAGEGWFDNRMKEILEVTVPYAVFEKLARAQFLELAVGRNGFGLRDKNVAALRDLNNRVRVSERNKN